MKYPQLREKIRSGDLIALSHYKWASWYDLQVQAVRVFTQSEYCHVGIAVVWGGRVWVIESVTPLIRLVPLSLFVEDGFYHVGLPDMSEKELDFALANVGVGKYSKVQAVMAKLSNLPIGKDALWQCAEFVITCRRLSGIDLGEVATPSAVVASALENGTLSFVRGH